MAPAPLGSAAMITPEIVAEHGLAPDEYAAHPQRARPRAQPRRARHLLGDVVRALLVQELAHPLEEAADRGAVGDLRPGRECRRDRHRRRPGGDLQDGEPQPPELHRALSGRGDRGRRDPARRLHHGRAADRQSERAALRPARPSQDAPPDRGRGRGHRRLRQLRRRARRSAARSISTPPTTATSSSTR